MRQTIAHVAIVVGDYDEAIAYYTNVLGFDLVEDTPLGGGKRWVLVRPAGSDGTCLLLAARPARNKKAASATRRADAFSCFCIPTTSGATITQ